MRRRVASRLFTTTVRSSSCSILSSCAATTGDVVETVEPGVPYVSPYTNTSLGGTHVTQQLGRPMGTITIRGDVAVLELDEGAVTDANLFDLDGRTLRFNGDGTFTVLDRGSMMPASGYSYLELYLVGVLPPEGRSVDHEHEPAQVRSAPRRIGCGERVARP
ncbi:MAG: hypothetical protein WEF86_02150 [Gemmatimonadota bacterium]